MSLGFEGVLRRLAPEAFGVLVDMFEFNFTMPISLYVNFEAINLYTLHNKLGALHKKGFLVKKSSIIAQNWNKQEIKVTLCNLTGAVIYK